MSSEKSVTPQIRFKGFTEAWEQRKLGELFEYLSSQVQASQAQAEGRYKLFDASSQIGYSSTGSNRPLITIIKDGSGVGRIRLIPYNSWFIGTLGGLLANETDVDFGYALLQNIDFSIYIIGSTIPHIYFKDYSTAPLLIAKIKEQQMIGKVFSKIDSLITLHQRKLDVLKKIKSALLEKMFPKDGSDIPEIRFTGFTEAWEQRKLGELFEYLSSQVQASQAQAEGRYKLFDASSQIGYSSTGSNRPLITIIKDGSGVGRIRLIPYNSWFIGTLGGLLANETDVDFGYALLQNIDFSIYIIGSTIPHIYFKDYSTAPLLIAKIKEQQMIGKVFSKIDSLITLHQRKLNALKKIKSALLEKMFV